MILNFSRVRRRQIVVISLENLQSSNWANQMRAIRIGSSNRWRERENDEITILMKLTSTRPTFVIY